MPASINKKIHYRTESKPKGLREIEQPVASNAARLADREKVGRDAWEAIHKYEGNSVEWFAKWELSIPQFGCSCANEYREYKAANPPDFSSPEALWLWGFNLHNWVNRKLGKPELTIEEAKKLWRGDNNGMECNQEEQERNLD